MPFNAEKLAKLIGSRSGPSGAGPSTVRLGGKGTVRRKRKAVRKAANVDDKRLKSTLNRLNVRDIPAIEEVNLFKEDGNVIHFTNPKVQASIAANTYVISGHAETKKLQDLLPGIINQLGPDNLEHLKKVYASFASKSAPGGGGAKTGGGSGAATAAAAQADDDDDVPELVENFEDVSKKAPMDFGPKVPAPEPAGGLGPAKSAAKVADLPVKDEKKSAPAAATTAATKAAAAAASGGGGAKKAAVEKEDDGDDDGEDDGDDPDDPNAAD